MVHLGCRSGRQRVGGVPGGRSARESGGVWAGDNGGAGGEQKQSRVEAAERLARAAKPGQDELVGCVGVL